MPLDPQRPEIAISRVANGWIIQPTAMFKGIDPATNAPWAPHGPEGTYVATNPAELTAIIESWAKQQVPLVTLAGALPAAAYSPSYQD